MEVSVTSIRQFFCFSKHTSPPTRNKMLFTYSQVLLIKVYRHHQNLSQRLSMTRCLYCQRFQSEHHFWKWIVTSLLDILCFLWLRTCTVIFQHMPSLRGILLQGNLYHWRSFLSLQLTFPSIMRVKNMQVKFTVSFVDDKVGYLMLPKCKPCIYLKQSNVISERKRLYLLR